MVKIMGMKKIIVAIATLALSACAVFRPPTVVEVKPTDVADFLQNPFKHTESISAFTKHMPPRTKVQKLIKRTPRDQHSPDTIYNFIYKKSKISIYKTRYNQEFLLGGIVRNPEIELVNGVRQGMSRSDFFKAFNNLSAITSDTVVVNDKKMDRTLKFYFNRQNRLAKYTFTGKGTTSTKTAD